MKLSSSAYIIWQLVVFSLLLQSDPDNDRKRDRNKFVINSIC